MNSGKEIGLTGFLNTVLLNVTDGFTRIAYS